MFPLDEKLLLAINGLTGHWPLADKAFSLIASDYLVPVGFSLVLLGLWFSGSTPAMRHVNQRLVMVAAGSLGLINALIKLMNLIYYRPRPFLHLDINLLFYPPTDSSMPSNAAAVAFALATAAWLYRRRIGLWLYIPASLLAFSRVYVGIHYPLDVIAGAALGCLTSYGVKKLFPFLEPLPRGLLSLARRLYLA